MSKVNDFCMIGELGLLITASTDKTLRIFKVQVRDEEDAGTQAEVGQVSLVSVANFSRDSNHRALQLSYERKRNLLLVLNSDNTIEVFKVNVDKPEAILKKLVRQEKKKAAKRTHSEMEEQDDEAPVKRTVDKEQLQK